MTIGAGALVDVGDFGDTGWDAVAVEAGFTSALQIRRQGDRVNVKGNVAPSTNWGAANTSNIVIDVANAFDAGFRPPESLTFTCASGATTALVTFRVTWQANGLCQVRCDTATHTGACVMNFDYLAN